MAINPVMAMAAMEIGQEDVAWMQMRLSQPDGLPRRVALAAALLAAMHMDVALRASLARDAGSR